MGGSLFMSRVSPSDSGEYVCSVGEDLRGTGVLNAYVMPSYTLDISLLLGINLVLLILFTISVVFNHLRYREIEHLKDSPVCSHILFPGVLRTNQVVMASNRKIQESSSKTLRDLASIHENRFCFDCNQRGPTYACRKIYLALCGGKEPDERNSNFDDYLRLKYQVQKWYRSPDPETEEEALKENEEALNRTTQSPAKKVAHIGANAAAGLIILTNRSLPTLLPAPSASTEQTSTAGASTSEPASSSTQSATHSQPFSPKLVCVIDVKIAASPLAEPFLCGFLFFVDRTNFPSRCVCGFGITVERSISSRLFS
uniref:Ig-like domain-containing protein n=1 Tax=Mesocestoides corti TaxID=53468 RepID=A0A5K3F4Q5_MESCO